MEQSLPIPKKLTIDAVLGPIQRKDNEFQIKLDPISNKPAKRIGGSSFSSGIFIEKNTQSE